MTKTEFIETLRKSLYGKVDDNELVGNISYYSSYIDNEVLSGRSEQEVVAELGDPRLIAKTIVETYKLKDDPIRRQYDTESQEYQEDVTGEEDKGIFDGKIKEYIKIALIVFVILAVLSIIFKVILAILPVIVVVILVLLIIKLVR
ncbi:MAG: DUF1700 domain-containing protein [Lachnospiraceae bacterium]|nr:DUF1700 domain-containing protein [Lachnospiraceae bacterium]